MLTITEGLWQEDDSDTSLEIQMTLVTNNSTRWYVASKGAKFSRLGKVFSTDGYARH